jgi:hypothetical protein
VRSSFWVKLMIKFKVRPGHVLEVQGKVLRSGDEFEAPEKEAVMWRLLGKVTEVTASLPEKRRYNRRDMTAED